MRDVLPDERHDPPQDALSVTEFTSRVKEHVESRFADVWLTGEISNLVRASSGHVYLSLKDEDSLLRAVIWRGTRQSLAIEPSDGLQVVCHGRIEVYPPRGTYQLTIDRLHAVGTGALEARLRQLHAALEREGLFAPERKRPIPRFPQRVAVVTSPTGAAVADFLAGRSYELQILGGIHSVRAFFKHPPSVSLHVHSAGLVNRAYTGYETPGKLAPLIPWQP
ncbi:MAG: exodeoxyribonuclease VII large subunit [Gammaproteobacteria bacterium]|nr:exodeoxyribonuclease VII large subunit [Gammaproteobacteria bacterium]